MASSLQPVQLSVSQVEELARHLSSFRHDVNGCLSLIVAATELIRYNPDVVKRMATTLIEQPPRIAGKTHEFVLECHRVLGLRNGAEASWYRDMWKRNNAPPGESAAAVSVTPETVKALHTEVLALGKELTHLAFIVSGAEVVSSLPGGAHSAGTAAEQLPKVTRKFDQLATALENAMRLPLPAPRRLASGSPSGPVELGTDQIMIFERRLADLERDIAEHLIPLIELSVIARADPQRVEARAAEFAQQPPKISAVISEFASQFDSTFRIQRNA